ADELSGGDGEVDAPQHGFAVVADGEVVDFQRGRGVVGHGGRIGETAGGIKPRMDAKERECADEPPKISFSFLFLFRLSPADPERGPRKMTRGRRRKIKRKGEG